MFNFFITVILRNTRYVFSKIDNGDSYEYWM